MAGGTAGNWMIGAIGRAIQARVLSLIGSRSFIGYIAKLE